MTQKAIASVAVTLVLFLFSYQTSAQENLKLFTVDEIQAELSSVPCKDGERLQAVKSLFEKFGASSNELKIETFKHVENLVVRKQGDSEEVVVVGAHYDKITWSK